MMRTFGPAAAVGTVSRQDILTMIIVCLPNYPFGTSRLLTFYRERIERYSSLPGSQAASSVTSAAGCYFDTVGTKSNAKSYGPGEQPYPERYF